MNRLRGGRRARPPRPGRRDGSRSPQGRRACDSAALRLLAMSALAAGLQFGTCRPAYASDAPLRRTLEQVGCLSPLIRSSKRLDGVLVHQVECSRRRMVTVLCDRAGCRVQKPVAEEGER